MTSVFLAQLNKQQETLDSLQAQINSLSKFSKQHAAEIKSCNDKVMIISNLAGQSSAQPSIDPSKIDAIDAKVDDNFKVLDEAIGIVNKSLGDRIDALEKRNCQPKKQNSDVPKMQPRPKKANKADKYKPPSAQEGAEPNNQSSK